jgi:hypothetical protein
VLLVGVSALLKPPTGWVANVLAKAYLHWMNTVILNRGQAVLLMPHFAAQCVSQWLCDLA